MTRPSLRNHDLPPGSFEAYLADLRWLVDQPSPFTDPPAVTALMAGVNSRMAALLPAYRRHLDAAGNLVCIPPSVAPGAALLFLSAHADTVPADASLWTPPFAPHPAFEDDTQLVAQGVNDCKAGVAAQLWLAHLASSGAIGLRNVVFTFTFKEEGAGAKTGAALGEGFGTTLPAPTPGSTLLVLENTVRSAPPYVPLVYATESSSYTIRITGSLAQLGAAQRTLSDWRPVAIAPTESVAANYSWASHQPQGHVCTAPPEKNPLLSALLGADATSLLSAGDERSHGTVPARIGRASSSGRDVPHRLTLTKRGNFPLAAVIAELAPFAYSPVKPLAQSVGFDAFDRCSSSPVGAAFLAEATAGETAFERNPGASDATIVTSALPVAYRDLLLPLVCGPGTRAQRDATPPRYTHGPNETFVKAAGARSLTLIFAVLRRAGHIV